MQHEKGRDEAMEMMAKALRHRPEAFGLVLDAQGWVDANALIEAIHARGMTFDRARMDRIVQLNNKRRFAYSDDGTLMGQYAGTAE